MEEKQQLIISTDAASIQLIEKIAVEFNFTSTTIQAMHQLQSVYDKLQPQLIILDLNFGEMDGIQLVNYLHNIHCKSSLILIGSEDERLLMAVKHVAETKQLLVIDFTQKPLQVHSLHKIYDYVDLKSPKKINASSIAKALENNAFSMVYQPKIDIKSKKLLGLEALIRWNHSSGIVIPPNDFIHIAEESGLIAPLTHWVIRQVFEDYSNYHKTKPAVQFALNLSPKMLTDLVFPLEAAKLAKEYGVDPTSICFEITETGVSHQSSIILEVLTHLRVLGFSLSIDDFGTGYSSIAELQRLPFNELKVDRSFVLELANSNATKTIVKSTIELGHNLNMSLVAEGVESQDVLNILEELNCDNIQGYLVSRPVSMADLDIWHAQFIDKNETWIHPNNEDENEK